MDRVKWIVVVLMLLILLASAGAEAPNTPSSSSQAAPDFTLPDQDGKLWKLSDTLKDYRAVVLAFYPLDDAGA